MSRSENSLTRRRFLKRMGMATLTASTFGGAAGLLAGCRGGPARNATANGAGADPLSLRDAARFTDITVESGLDFVQYSGTYGRRYFVEQVAATAVLFDANGDGHLDIYFPQPKPIGVSKSHYKEPLHHRLYINDGKGHFALRPDAFGGVDTPYGITAIAGDFNNDGHPDLYVCCYGGNKLFRNRGDGTFEDVTEKAGVGLQGLCTGAVWFDYDNDGFLDLFVCRYCVWTVDSDHDCKGKDDTPDVCAPTYYQPATDVLYHNNGDGTFTEVTHRAGIGNVAQRSLGVAAADFHGQGRLDLFVANDVGPNFLYRNNGDGTFEEVGAQEGVAYGRMNSNAMADMGVAVGDYDEDGDLDVLVTTFSGEPKTLFRNEGGKYFTDASLEAGTAQPSTRVLTFGCGFFDARNLGRLDLFFANGHVNPYIHLQDPAYDYKEPNMLLLSDGAGHYTEAQSALPKDDIRVHRGACFGDVDGDGRIDILVTSTDDRPTLLHNDSPAGNWLLVALTDKHGCSTPVGARCTAAFGGKRRMRALIGGGSYGGGNDPRIHFGLGTAAVVDRLEVRWLSGQTTVLTAIKANQVLTVREPQ